MIEYATDTSSWEPWQREYLYGAFYIFPPVEIIGPIDDLRGTYDPRSAATCQAHISLSQPLSRPLTAAPLAEVTHALMKHHPFVIHYGPLRSFPPYPGVVYAIKPEAEFRALRSALHTTSLFDGVDTHREEVAPHMTVAEFISLDRTKELLDRLKDAVPAGRFTCDRIEYAIPDAAFRFGRVLAIPLGSGAAAPGCPWP